MCYCKPRNLVNYINIKSRAGPFKWLPDFNILTYIQTTIHTYAFNDNDAALSLWTNHDAKINQNKVGCNLV